MHYTYCPDCGKKLIDKMAGDDGYVPFCNACGKYWFDSFHSCSIVMVVNEYEEVALLTQNYLSDHYRTFVAGYITPGETAEGTALREVQEEIGITLERLEFAGTYWFDAKGLLMHGFVGYAQKCAFKTSSEVDAVEWVALPDVGPLLFPDRPGNAAWAIYKKYLAEWKSGS